MSSKYFQIFKFCGTHLVFLTGTRNIPLEVLTRFSLATLNVQIGLPERRLQLKNCFSDNFKSLNKISSNSM